MYDFEAEFTYDESTNKWGVRFYDMSEPEFTEWLVLIMKIRDWLIKNKQGGSNGNL